MIARAGIRTVLQCLTGTKATGATCSLSDRFQRLARPEQSCTSYNDVCRITPVTKALDHLPETFSYGQAMAAGMSRHRLYALRNAGELELVGRGLYRRAGAALADFDLLEAAHRAPLATICLLSALARHDLTDTIPAQHDLALPRGTWHPRLSAPIKWHSFDPDTFTIGRTTVHVDGQTQIGLYDAPRSVIDAYRLRDDLGIDVAHEALRRWLRSGGQPAVLLDTARAFPHARPAILTALEILL